MSRLQLALNVSNLEVAISHYTKLFGTAPAKIRPGYANFAIENPPLKLVLTWVEGETTCCYAVQEKFWVEGGDHRYEVYTVLADAEQMKNTPKIADVRSAEVCCAPDTQSVNITAQR
ncbi:MAG: glyoxalase/bleomycin resistance/dioxygenase family protein [Actinobacteria bacterium]|nr:glyoxalase/bleomycin resistance/dioxygenase family protein [Actinomycetota bacterium]